MNLGRGTRTLDDEVKVRVNQLSSLRNERRRQNVMQKRMALLENHNPEIVIRETYPELKSMIIESFQNQNMELLKSNLQKLYYFSTKTIDENITVDFVNDISQLLLPILQIQNLQRENLVFILNILTNISSTNGNLHPFLTNGILDAMKYYAGIDDSEIIAMVLTFISNMINESTEVMLFIFNAGFYEILIQLKDKVLSAVSLQNAYSWCFCNICRNVTFRNGDFIRNLIPLILLNNNTSEAALIDILWGIFILSKNIQQFGMLKELNVFEFIFKTMKLKNNRIYIPVLKILETYAYEDEKYFDYFLQFDIFKWIKKVLLDPQLNELNYKSICFILSNLVVSTKFRKILCDEKVIEFLIHSYIKQSETIKTEIKYVIVNCFIGADDQEVFYLCQIDQIYTIFADFIEKDERLVELYLGALIKIDCVGQSCFGEEENQFLEKMKEAGVMSMLEYYMHSQHIKISEMATAFFNIFNESDKYQAEDWGMDLEM